MKVGLGSDHAGFRLKEALKEHLAELGYEVLDFGCPDETSVDYPTVAAPVARAVAAGECDRAILCCGTGLGMSITANKVRGIRAACCSDCYSAKLARVHNDANVLCVGQRVIGEGLALLIADLFMTTEYEGGGRHDRRLGLIAEIEREEAQKES